MILPALETLFFLVVLLGVSLISVRLLKGVRGASSNNLLSVEGSLSLGGAKSVVVLRYGQRRFLLGMTAQEIRLLYTG